MNDQIQNSIKKLVYLNLINIFKQDIIFVGSICDHIYVSYPLEQTKDIDLLVNYDYRYTFFNKLFYNPFIIPGEKHNRARLCNTHSSIRNFNRHITTYKNYNYFTYKYSYHLYIFGICLDINFIKNKLQYKSRYWNKPLIRSNINKYNQYTLLNNGMLIESKESRLNKLQYSIKNKNINDQSKNKHLTKIKYYKNYNKKNNLNLFNDIETYQLPNNFDVKIYQKIHEDLHPMYLDGALDHFLAHGIKENRNYHKS